jgi:predicted transcriptional regulator
MPPPSDDAQLLTLTTQIVSAYVGRQTIPQQELGSTIRMVHATLQALRGTSQATLPRREPAVPIARSITPDHLICLEDGRRLKTLKRHLRAAYGLSPEAYRARWGLAANYPMVAPNYAKRRSQLAKAQELGRRAPRTTR